MIRRILRLYRFECRKLLSRKLPVLAAIAVVLVTLLAPAVGHIVDTTSSLMRGQSGGADEFENGWTVMSGAISTARFFLVLTVLLLAGSSIAEEHADGTFRALLVRPVRRMEILWAKALAIWSYAVALLIVVVATAALAGELTQGLYDLVDPEFPTMEFLVYGDMWTYVFQATALTILPLAALTSMGLFVSTVVEHPGYATGMSIGALFLLSAVAGLDKEWRPYVFVSYVSYPFDTVQDLANQFTNTRGRFDWKYTKWLLAVPALWSVGLLGLSALILERRDVR